MSGSRACERIMGDCDDDDAADNADGGGDDNDVG